MHETIKYDLSALQNLAEEYDAFLIVGHTNPDGDCIGAALALGMALNDLHKKVYVCLEEYSERYDVIPGKELVCANPNIAADVAIALDCSSIDRLGDFADIYNKAKVTVNIDHHIGNTNFAMKNYIYEKASSTSEIVYNLINSWILVNERIASAIYAGLAFDTGGFRHCCTTPEIHRTVANLMELDIPFTTIYNKIMHEHTFNEAKALAAAINTMEINDGICFAHLSMEDIKSLGVAKKDLGDIIDYIFMTENVTIAAFLYETADKQVKVSMRAKEKNVNEIALSFGGGGHKLAAGCTLQESLQDALNIIKRKFAE